MEEFLSIFNMEHASFLSKLFYYMPFVQNND